MTILTATQKAWIEDKDEGLITGIILWDLSAAYDDTVCPKLFSEKSKIYGFDGKNM